MNFVFVQRGILHPGINQHDMVIRIRFALKVAIAGFLASWSGCECLSDDCDFLAFA
jgi:hypothetical protein